MQGFDFSTIKDCYIGNNQAKEIWCGDHKVWPITAIYTDTTTGILYRRVPTSEASGQDVVMTNMNNVINDEYVYDPTAYPLICALDINFCGADLGNTDIITISDLLKILDTQAIEIYNLLSH